MTLAVVKEKLHEYIEHADKKKIQAIYTLLESEIAGTDTLYDEGTLNMLNETSEAYHAGKMKSYTVEESMERIRKQVRK
jgi:hypothetical protein